MTNDAQFFQFEADFVDSLRCIPMQVRMKLDSCGVKLKLQHWHQFSAAERQQLAHLPGSDDTAIAAYGDYVRALVDRYQGSPPNTLPVDLAPAWYDAQTIPAEVQAQALTYGCVLTLAQWQTLQPLQRFALIKLSCPGHENRNFYPALVEFELCSEVA